MTGKKVIYGVVVVLVAVAAGIGGYLIGSCGGQGERTDPPDYYCDECGIPPEGEGWWLDEGHYEIYKTHMTDVHGKNHFCEVEVDKSPPEGEFGPCGEAFADATELQEHMGIAHPTEPPDYYCDECGAPPEGEGWYLTQGTYPPEYQAHMEGHGRGFLCDVVVDKSPPDGEEGPCGAAFAREAELSAHKEAEHPGY